jgi:uncharacterized protein YbjT (DUF2867 family)
MAMTADQNLIVVVTGATGLQGGAVARRLLSSGWQVRALTRNSKSDKAQKLAALGAQVVEGNMDEPALLVPVFSGAYGIFSVQNPYLSGLEGEIRQGKNVADVAKQSGLQHLVYTSTGTGDRGSGIPSWETKLAIEDHIKSLGIPWTILRPPALMELMTEKKFFPAVSTWNLMPELMGVARKIGWVCTEDVAIVTEKAFAEPDRFIGEEIMLAGDVKSIDQCRSIYRRVMGKNPPRFPMPLWLFSRFGLVGEDLTTMWRWLRASQAEFDTSPTRAVHPEALTVDAWLERQKIPQKVDVGGISAGST